MSDASLNKAEQGALNLFRDTHVCRKAPWWRRQPVRAVRVIVTQTGIAPAYTARCTCGLEADISDYGSW